MADSFYNKRLISQIDALIELFRPELLESRLKETSIERKPLDPETANTDDLELALDWLRQINVNVFAFLAEIRSRHPAHFWQNVKVFGTRGLEEVKLLHEGQKRLKKAYLSTDRPDILFKVNVGREGLTRRAK